MPDCLPALILGSGSASLPGLREGEAVPVPTPWGEPSAPVRDSRLGGERVLTLARHGEPHAIAPHRIDYRANVAALAAAGATHVVAINTVGGIAPQALPGTLWLPDQIVDYTWGRESSFNDGTRLPLGHLEFGEPYDPDMRDCLLAAASACAQALAPRGVYGCTQGPRLETAAEIARLARDGCDLVGMTGMPEAALAREAGLRYASLALVVNRAAGLSDGPISLEEIREESLRCLARAAPLLLAALRALARVG